MKRYVKVYRLNRFAKFVVECASFVVVFNIMAQVPL
jgi:hypothetical protein